MKNKFFKVGFFFEPGARSSVDSTSSSSVSAVEQKIEQAKKMYESRLNSAPTANAVVLGGREFRKSNEFKKILIDIKNLNEQDRKKIDSQVWDEISRNQAQINEIVNKYKTKYGDAEGYKKLANDKTYQSLNAYNTALHEMRKVNQEDRIKLNVKEAEAKGEVAKKTSNKLSGIVKDNKDVGTNSDVKSLVDKVVKNPNDLKSALEYSSIMFANLDGSKAVFGSNRVESGNNFNLLSGNTNKFPVGELALYKLIKRNPEVFQSFMSKYADKNSLNALTQKYANDKDVYASVEKIMMEFVKPAQKELIKRVDALSQIQQFLTENTKNSSVPVERVLQGNEQLYIQELLNNKDVYKKIQDKPESEKQNILGKIVSIMASIGVTVAIPGAYFRVEQREITDQLKGHPLAMKLGEGPLNLTAKLGLLSATVQANWGDKENKIIDSVKKIAVEMDKINPEKTKKPITLEQLTKIDPSLKDSPVVKMYLENPNNYSYNALMDTVVYNKIIELGKKEEGTGIKGLEATAAIPNMKLGVGLSAQNIESEFRNSDSKVAKAVVEKIGGMKSNIVEYSQMNGQHRYVMENVDGLESKLKEKTGNNLKLENIDGKLVVTTPVALSINAKSHIDSYGNEEVVYVIEKGNTVNIKTEGTSDKLDRTQAGKKLGEMVYKLNRKDGNFDKIITQISSGNYEQAYDLLSNNPKYSGIKKEVSTPDGKTFDPQKLHSILTYTYGAKEVKNGTGSITEKAYNNSRTQSVLKAESNVVSKFAGSKISPNESAFNSGVHTPTQASKMYPGQTISLSVVATPRGGTHRIDHFNNSVEISNKTVEIKDVNLKKSLLEAYGAQVDKEVASLKNSGINISKSDYIDIVLGNKKPEKVVTGLNFNSTPKFFEGRAMLNHNVCNNLTYGLAFPTFNVNGNVAGVENQTSSYSAVGGVTVTEIAGGVSIDLSKNKQQEENKETSTKPKSDPNANPAKNQNMTSIVGKGGEVKVGVGNLENTSTNFTGGATNIVDAGEDLKKAVGDSLDRF